MSMKKCSWERRRDTDESMGSHASVGLVFICNWVLDDRGLYLARGTSKFLRCFLIEFVPERRYEVMKWDAVWMI